MPKVLMIIGSLRKKSFNRQLAEGIRGVLERRAEVEELDYLDLPWMNQDLEDPVQDSVARIRSAIMSADGLWFVCPEYNGNIPGHVKNLIDWMSRPSDPADRKSPSVLAGKKATTSGCAGRSASRNVQGKLTDLFKVLRMQVLDAPTVGIVLDGQAFSTDVLTLTEEDHAAIAAQVEAFLEFIAE
ncbi:MAG: NAD(P)H-dependent oxidoreductase [Atopobiaceae bacterium]|nr:NAD(P)H-dependent oxidoreductase [Atopobiaceae bacterium]